MQNLEQRVIYITCPVRKMTEEERIFLNNYVARLEANGHSVHYPPRDADQTDPSGLRICTTHKDAMKKCNEVQVYWNPTSEGSVFDFGMLFYGELPVSIINQKDVKRTEHKSYTNVLLDLAKKHKEGGFSPARPKSK